MAGALNVGWKRTVSQIRLVSCMGLDEVGRTGPMQVQQVQIKGEDQTQLLNRSRSASARWTLAFFWSLNAGMRARSSIVFTVDGFVPDYILTGFAMLDIS